MKTKPQTPWFEVISDDFLEQGPHHKKLELLRQDYPIALHSIGMNIGGVDNLNKSYLKTLKELYQKYEPEWISDHLCWSRFGETFHHDLLPIPRTKEGLNNAKERIQFLQDYFRRPLVIENITSYLEFNKQEYTETEFINELINSTDCFLLLDVSNVLINQKNNSIDASEFIKALPLDRVKQIHLSGGEEVNGTLVDTHGTEVKQPDVQLLTEIYKQGCKIPSMIERDTAIPSFETLESERIQIEEAVNGL